MKIGDVVVYNGLKWIIYDTIFMNNIKMFAITDFETQRENEVIAYENLTEVIEMPENVYWLFIVKRNRNLKEIVR